MFIALPGLGKQQLRLGEAKAGVSHVDGKGRSAQVILCSFPRQGQLGLELAVIWNGTDISGSCLTRCTTVSVPPSQPPATTTSVLHFLVLLRLPWQGQTH